LYADEGYLGSHPWPAYATVVGNRITVHALDLMATYSFTPSTSLAVTVPYLDGSNSNPLEHDGTRHTVHSIGIGDIRVVLSNWLFDPETHPYGNISLGAGIKLPTGNEDAKATFYRPDGPQILPVDIAIQRGDGGVGLQLEFSGFFRLTDWLYSYANGYYLVTPREQNKATTKEPFYGEIRHLSTPDQYLLRMGATLTRWPTREMSLFLGAYVNGIPAHDLIGGSEGFRRSGYVVYAEPGLAWSDAINTFNLSVPVRVLAARTPNVYEEQAGAPGGGAFASNLFVVSYWRTF
jgi:hypothetical protein